MVDAGQVSENALYITIGENILILFAVTVDFSESAYSTQEHGHWNTIGIDGFWT